LTTNSLLLSGNTPQQLYSIGQQHTKQTGFFACITRTIFHMKNPKKKTDNIELVIIHTTPIPVAFEFDLSIKEKAKSVESEFEFVSVIFQ
jgi:hypothetical protein